MSEWVHPVERVGDVIVVGERHRERSSREVLFTEWDELSGSVGGVCVEVGPGVGYRDDGGGAVGGALVRAEESDIPRYYVDTPVEEVIEAFGGRLRAHYYLKELKERVPMHEEGLVDMAFSEKVREEFVEKYGEEAFYLLFEKREEYMAQRAKWVSEKVDGVVFLIVGAAHFRPVVSLLESGCGEMVVGDSRKRTGDRFGANMSDWGKIIAINWIAVKELYSMFSEWMRERSELGFSHI